MHIIEKRSFIGSNKMFKKNTGWKPKVKLNNGIKKIIKIFKENNENYN